MTINFGTSVDALAEQARNSAIGDPERRSIVSSGSVHPKPRDGRSPVPRLELFHFTMSICSQKIRGALFQIGAPFASSELIIVPPFSENYSAEYVRLRMASAIARSRRFVSGELFWKVILTRFDALRPKGDYEFASPLLEVGARPLEQRSAFAIPAVPDRDSRGQAGDQRHSMRDLIDRNANRHALAPNVSRSKPDRRQRGCAQQPLRWIWYIAS